MKRSLRLARFREACEAAGLTGRSAHGAQSGRNSSRGEWRDRGTQTRSTSGPGMPVLEVQAASSWQTLAISLRRTVLTETLEGTVDQMKRKRSGRLQPGTRLIMSRAMRRTFTLPMLITI